MDVIIHCCQNLQEHVNVVDRRLGLGDLLARTIQKLERSVASGGTASPQFPVDYLVVTGVVAVRTNRPVTIVEGLNLIFHMIVEGMLARSSSASGSSGAGFVLDQVPFFSSVSALIVGKPAVWVILEGLCHVMQAETLETALHMKAVSCVAAITSDTRLPLTGTILVSTIQACFNLALTSTQAGVQARARQVLRAMLRDRVVRPVVVRPGSAADTSATPVFMMLSAQVHRPDLDADPQEYLPSLRFVRSARHTQNQQQQRPDDVAPESPPQLTGHVKDIIILLESLCALATQAIPSTVKTPDEIEVRTRQLALDCITCILLDFPEVTAEQEKSILAPVLVHVEDSLWNCVGTNIATTAPSSFFVSAVHVLTIIATRAHYALYPSLRKFFERVVFPVAKSRYSTLEQKIGLLSVVRSIFSRPELVIAYFCNYDCLAPIEQDVGFLQFILHNVVEIAFLDFASDATSPSVGSNVWVVLSGLQQSTLRCECLSLVGMFVEALWRWLEEPVSKGQHARVNSAALGKLSAAAAAAPAAAAPVAPPPLLPVANATTTPTSAESTSMPTTPSPPDQQQQQQQQQHAGGNNSNNTRFTMNATTVVSEFGEPELPPQTLYHWKHLHHAMVNRLVLLQAKQTFDAAGWKAARLFLMEKKVISDSAADFAHWIRNTPRLKKSAICLIFEKMFRDSFNVDVVRAYIATFDFAHKPVDVGLGLLLTSLMSGADVPKFEGQIWEKLLALFADAFHAQNKDDPDPQIALSLDDVDTFANAVFFLHSTEHNAAVRDKMTQASFARNARDMVQVKMPEAFFHATFDRVVRSPWAPPQQQVTEISAFTEWKAPLWGAVPNKRSSAHLWGGSMASHSEYFSSLRYAEQLQLRYIQRASDCVAAFLDACGGSAAAVRAETLQAAYCPPHYAIHVRLILRLFYPVIAAAAILGNKMSFTGPHVTLAQTLNHHVLPLMSLFGIDFADPTLRTMLAKLFQKLLEQEHSATTAFAGHPGIALLSTTSFV